MASKSGKMLPGLYTLILFILVGMLSSVNAQTIAVRSAVVSPGDTVTLPIEISQDVTGIFGFQLDLDVIPPSGASLLRIDDISKGGAVTIAPIVDSNPIPPTFQGVRIGLSTEIPAEGDPRPTLDGPGSIVNIDFLVPADATVGQGYHINLTNVIFAGPGNLSQDFNILGGTLTVGDVTAPADTS